MNLSLSLFRLLGRYVEVDLGSRSLPSAQGNSQNLIRAAPIFTHNSAHGSVRAQLWEFQGSKIRMGKLLWTKMWHVDSKKMVGNTPKKGSILNNINNYSSRGSLEDFGFLVVSEGCGCRCGRPCRQGMVTFDLSSVHSLNNFGLSLHPAHTCSNKFNLPSSHILDWLEYGIHPSNQSYILSSFSSSSLGPRCHLRTFTFMSSSLPTVINLRPKAERILPWHILWDHSQSSGLPRAPLGNLGHQMAGTMRCIDGGEIQNVGTWNAKTYLY